jgi:hypothetical protein
MGCVLRAYGSNFLVDRFCQKSDLTPCLVYRKGESKSAARKSKGKVYESSGLHVEVSDADFIDLEGQVKDAITFMERNKVELERLREFPGVEGLTLDFGIARRDFITQCDYFPPELLYLAGGLGFGIELSQYPMAGVLPN